ncbi:transposase domain-containing protein [Pseudoroseomonas cervicalis]
MTAVLDRLARGHTIDRIDELLPWNFRLTDSLAGTG